LKRPSKAPAGEADPRTQRILAMRTAALAARGTDLAAEDTLTVLVCEAAGSLYGLSLSEVERVEVFARHGAAPSGHAAFLGLASVSGRVRPVLDLAGLTSGTVAADAGGYLIVPRGDRGALRVVGRPTVVEARILEEDPGRAIVIAEDEHQGRLLSLLSLAALLAQTPAAETIGA